MLKIIIYLKKKLNLNDWLPTHYMFEYLNIPLFQYVYLRLFKFDYSSLNYVCKLCSQLTRIKVINDLFGK